VGGALESPLCQGRRYLAKVIWNGEVLAQQRFDVEVQD
jgi:hypothetical protein